MWETVKMGKYWGRGCKEGQIITLIMDVLACLLWGCGPRGCCGTTCSRSGLTGLLIGELLFLHNVIERNILLLGLGVDGEDVIHQVLHGRHDEGLVANGGRELNIDWLRVCTSTTTTCPRRRRCILLTTAGVDVVVIRLALGWGDGHDEGGVDLLRAAIGGGVAAAAPVGAGGGSEPTLCTVGVLVIVAEAAAATLPHTTPPSLTGGEGGAPGGRLTELDGVLMCS